MTAPHLLLTGLGLSLASLGPSLQEPEPNEDLAPPPRAVELDGDFARIPFTLDGGRPVPLVEAMVNGQGPFKFFYDTGASACVLDSAFVEELGIEVLGPTTVGDHTASARIPAQEVEMESLELEGVSFEGIPAVAFDRSQLRGAEVRGVLGLPLFHQHLLTIDYDKGVLSITKDLLPEKGPGIVPYGGAVLPEILIQVGEEELSCHIDSGSPTGLMLATAVAERLPHKTEPILVGKARTVNSVLEIWSVQLDATVVIAGNELVDPVVGYNEMLPNALIGYQVLKDLVVSIDQRSKRVRLLPPKPAEPPAEPAERGPSGAGQD